MFLIISDANSRGCIRPWWFSKRGNCETVFFYTLSARIRTTPIDYIWSQGLRSARSMSLIARSGQAIGSFHSLVRVTTLSNELRFLVLLAREAAHLVEYWQSHALRQSAERMRRSR